MKNGRRGGFFEGLLFLFSLSSEVELDGARADDLDAFGAAGRRDRGPGRGEGGREHEGAEHIGARRVIEARRDGVDLERHEGVRLGRVRRNVQGCLFACGGINALNCPDSGRIYDHVALNAMSRSGLRERAEMRVARRVDIPACHGPILATSSST